MLACGYYGNGEITAMLLVAGADVERKNKLGLSAFQELRGRCWRSS